MMFAFQFDNNLLCCFCLKEFVCYLFKNESISLQSWSTEWNSYKERCSELVGNELHTINKLKFHVLAIIELSNLEKKNTCNHQKSFASHTFG
jgi:hypothetical protein